MDKESSPTQRTICVGNQQNQDRTEGDGIHLHCKDFGVTALTPSTKGQGVYLVHRYTPFKAEDSSI